MQLTRGTEAHAGDAERGLVAPVTTCCLCRSDVVLPLFETADANHRRIAIYQCSACFAMLPGYAPPTSRTQALQDQVHFHDELWPKTDEHEFNQVARDQEAMIDFYKSFLTHGLVCDVGGGRGTLTAALKRSGYTVRSCEPSTYLHSLGARYGGLTADEWLNIDVEQFVAYLRETQAQVGALFLWHVIEHLPDPLSVLRDVASVLEPGAYVIGQCPGLLQSYIFPEHYFFASESSLATLARNAGFELVRLDYDHGLTYMSFVFRRLVGDVPSGKPKPNSETLSVDLKDVLLLKNEELRRQDELSTALTEEATRNADTLRGLQASIVRQEREIARLESELHARTKELDAATAGVESVMQRLEEEERQVARLHQALDEALKHTREREKAFADVRARFDSDRRHFTTERKRLSEERAAFAERVTALAAQVRELERDRLMLLAKVGDDAAEVEPRTLWALATSLNEQLGLHLSHRIYTALAAKRGLSSPSAAPRLLERLLWALMQQAPEQLLESLEAGRAGLLGRASNRAIRSLKRVRRLAAGAKRP